MTGQEERGEDGEVASDDLAEGNKLGFHVYPSRHSYPNYRVTTDKKMVEKKGEG